MTYWRNFPQAQLSVNNELSMNMSLETGITVIRTLNKNLAEKEKCIKYKINKLSP